MDIHPSVLYVPYDMYLKEKNVNIILFAHYEEGGLISEYRNIVERGDESGDSDDDSTLPQLISEAKFYEMSSGDESYAEPITTYMLEDICDVIQYHLSINRGEVLYNIFYRIKQRRAEWKGALLSTLNMFKGSHNFLRLLLINFHNHYQSWDNQAQNFLT